MIFFIPKNFKISPCLTVLISSFAIHLLRFNDRKSLTHGKKLGPKFILSTNFLLDSKKPGNGKFPFSSKSSLTPGLTVLISSFVIHLPGLKDRKSLIHGQKLGPNIICMTFQRIGSLGNGKCIQWEMYFGTYLQALTHLFTTLVWQRKNVYVRCLWYDSRAKTYLKINRWRGIKGERSTTS